MYFTEEAAGAEELAELPVELTLAEDQGTVPVIFAVCSQLKER